MERYFSSRKELRPSAASLSDTRFAGPAAQVRFHPPLGGNASPLSLFFPPFRAFQYRRAQQRPSKICSYYSVLVLRGRYIKKRFYLKFLPCKFYLVLWYFVKSNKLVFFLKNPGFFVLIFSLSIVFQLTQGLRLCILHNFKIVDF